MYGPKLNRSLNPKTEILISGGANGALSSFVSALCNEGDELLLFEPAYPAYYDYVELAGAKMKTVPLTVKEGEWVFDAQQVRAALSDKTKVFVLNTPHNPTGKCFTREEQETLTEILKDFPHVVVIADEVYDFLTFDNKEHVRFATIGDNWNRTITMYSGGKLLNCTGWKVGWSIGPQKLIRLGGIVNNVTTFSTNTPAQVAISKSLKKAFEPDPQTGTIFVDLSKHNFSAVRDFLYKELKEMDLPWEPLPCHSGYFMMVNIEKCKDMVP